MKDLSKRLCVSLAILSTFLVFVIFSTHSWVRIVLTILVAAMAGVGVWEYTRLAVAKRLQPATVWMIGASAVLIIAFYIASICLVCAWLPLAGLMAGAILFFLLHFRDPARSLVHVAVEFFGFFYVTVPLGMMLAILYTPPHQDGRWWLVYLIASTKIVDVGGYFIGKLWGKHPLAPVLSPQKTVEGSIAGFICALLLSSTFQILGSKYSAGGFSLSLTQALALGMIIGVLGQIGDLAESMFKRDAAIKDSNNLPGLGGVLDLLDSLIFTAPVIYFFLRAVS